MCDKISQNSRVYIEKVAKVAKCNKSIQNSHM